MNVNRLHVAFSPYNGKLMLGLFFLYFMSTITGTVMYYNLFSSRVTCKKSNDTTCPYITFIDNKEYKGKISGYNGGDTKCYFKSLNNPCNIFKRIPLAGFTVSLVISWGLIIGLFSYLLYYFINGQNINPLNTSIFYP